MKLEEIPDCGGAEFRDRLNENIRAINALLAKTEHMPDVLCPKCGRPAAASAGSPTCKGCGHFIRR